MPNSGPQGICRRRAIASTDAALLLQAALAANVAAPAAAAAAAAATAAAAAAAATAAAVAAAAMFKLRVSHITSPAEQPHDTYRLIAVSGQNAL